MAVCFKLLLAKNNVRMTEKFHTGTSNAYLFFILSTCMEKQLCSENVTGKRDGELTTAPVQHAGPEHL